MELFRTLLQNTRQKTIVVLTEAMVVQWKRDKLKKH